MVRTYIRKTSRQSWSTDAMNQAVDAVVSGKMGYVAASNRYEVPSSTLERYVRKRRENPEAVVDKTSGKYHTVFTAEQEIELVNYLKDMQKQLFGMTMKEFRRLAYQLAEKNNYSHNFNKTSEMAGEDWVNGFLKRHRDLSLRKPEATSGARAMGFNKVAVSNFFTLLNEILDKHKIDATRIYNCDETGISVVPKQFSKIIANKGQRQVGILTSAERGTTVTAEICCSAAGSYMPPMLIFPRKKKQREYEIGLPPGGWAEVSDSGWMTADIFFKWFQQFILFSKATKEHPVLLLLDGHASHTKNLAVIDLARDSGVIILCFPPHCSHKLQPLDVAFMKPLSLYYEDEIRKWLRSHPGKVVQLFDISALFGQAFLNAANMRTAIKGFEKTGIWPSNFNIFTDDDFLPAATTDIPLENPAERTTQEAPTAPAATLPSIETLEDLSTSVVNAFPGTETPVDALPAEETPVDTLPSTETSKVHPTPVANNLTSIQDNPSVPTNDENLTPPVNIYINAKPGCSWMPDSPARTIADTNFSITSPKDIIPLPKVKPGMKRVTRKRGKTAILTASPYKTQLEESIKKTQNIKEAKEEKMKQKLTFKGKENKPKGKKTKPKKQKRIVTESEESSEEEDAACLYCHDLYSKSSEGWCSCGICKKWAHMACAGFDSDDDDSVLICELCQ